MRALVASIALALQLVAAPVRADETEDAALVHLERGVEAFHAGAYDRAHREFEAAQELAPDRPNPYRWLALTEVQLGDCATALGNIDGFLSRVPDDDPRTAEMIRMRVLCERSVAEAAAPPPPPPPPPRRRRSITRRWWFWPAVIGAAAAVTGAVIVVADEPDATRLPPIHCDGSGCAPGAR